MGVYASCSGSRDDVADDKRGKKAGNKTNKISKKRKKEMVDGCVKSVVNNVTSSIGVMVKVRVYNLRQGSNHLNSLLGFGIFHSGIEVFDREWSFGGNVNAKRGESGIFFLPPGMVLPKSAVYEVRDLGRLPPEATQEIIEMAVRQNMLRYWTAESYNLVSHNCNHFSEKFVDMLNKTFKTTFEFPSYINRAAKLLDTVMPESIIERIVGPTPPAVISPSNQRSKGNSDINLYTHTEDGIALGDFAGFSLDQMKDAEQRSTCQSKNCGGKCSSPICPRFRVRQETEAAAALESVIEEQKNRFAIPETRDDMSKLGLKQLKTIMWVNGIDWTGCLEKKDILDAIENFKNKSTSHC